MKTIAIFLGMFLFFNNESKTERVESKVYSFSKANIEKTKSGEKRQLIDGETTHLENFEIHTTMLEPGTAPHGSQVHTDYEEIVFVKEGRIEMMINETKKVLGPGSVALILPGDEHGIVNTGESQATYYIIKYKSKAAMDTERAKNAGESMLLDWESLEFKLHNKGGRRNFFDRKSAMSERIEMHATTLNPGIKSHEPHTHAPAEIIVMMDGTTEMEIGGKVYPSEVGDIYFLGSNIPHAIRNTGDKPCMYLAFQWE
ncbi:MAG TPA: cupin domain-containing protein [Draconibacterium sp.]|nr:cupin domain-containing protein [Draconibacterium sp.]